MFFQKILLMPRKGNKSASDFQLHLLLSVTAHFATNIKQTRVTAMNSLEFLGLKYFLLWDIFQFF